MEAFEESVTSDYASQGEFDEEASVNEESECTANYGTSIRWMKPASVFELMFVSHDVLLLRVENTLLFHNVKTQKEELLVVGGDDKSPLAAGDKFPLLLDGIGCVDCCGTDLLALSEHSPSAKVVICRYPDMKVLATLIDNSNAVPYKSIKLMKLEYLIGLRDYPAFDLVVWAWRIDEILLVVDTGFRLPNQSLKLHTANSGRDVYLSQTERDLTCKLQLWTVSVSYKTVFAKRTPVELPTRADVTTGCWTSPSDWFVFCDSSMDVYRTRPGAPKPEMCVKHAEDVDGRPSDAFVCPSAKGFVLYAVNVLTSFRDTDGVFTRLWIIFLDYTLYSMVAGDNYVYAWSDKGVLLKLTQRKKQQLKLYGADIKYFTFVGPTDETVATIDKTNNLQVWDVSTGELKSETKLNGIATNVCSNPVYYYVAVPFENGKVELWKTDPRTNDLEEISKLVLCDDELSSVKFFANGNKCVVTSFSTGRFFYVNIKLGWMCIAVRTFHWKKRIIDFEIIENEEPSSVIAAVYAGEPSTGTAGNNVVVFDRKFNVVFELKDMRYYYTSVFKRTGMMFNAPNTVNIAFTAINSTHVHLMTINITTRSSELNTVSLAHNPALDGVNAHVRKNHCVTSGGDGAYNVYWIRADGGPWTKAVTVNGCGQWQTGGLMAAQVDVGARHVLTLSRRGNFMCTSFGPDCDDGSPGRDCRPDQPTFVDDMKTGGIGFEDAPGQKRITLMGIMDSEITDPIFLANVDRKNRIQEEFEQIKKQLVRLLDVNENAPEDWRLDLEELDLNVAYRQKFREQSKTERQQYRVKVVRDMAEFEVQKNAIIKEHWECLFVKPKSIHCFNKWYSVNNYSISKTEQDVFTDTDRLLKKGSLTVRNWTTYQSVCNNYLKTSMENDTPLSDTEYNRLINNKPFTGSISHRFVDIIDNLNSSPIDLHTVEMVKNEIIFLQFTIATLKRSFNELFDKSFARKQNQLDNLNAHNERLREIENEIRLTCKAEPTIHSTVGYDWIQYEQTERLLRMEDHEVPAKPCRPDASSGERSLSSETASAKRFRFKQRVLNEVLAGILEKSWIEELRTDVAKPQCMLKRKRRANHAEEEDDFKAMAEYARAVAAKNNERTKYKHTLEDEQTRIDEQIVDIVNEMDKNVFELFETKSKYDAAIKQESLKITRLSKALDDDDRQKQRIRLREQADLELKRTIKEIAERIANIKEIRSSLLDTVKTLKGKLNRLDKRFKSEFRSKSLHYEALIVYNLRPKVLRSSLNSSSLLDYQFVDAITDPSSDRLDRLYTKFTKYLDVLEAYDDYNKYLNENKQNDVHDEQTWRTICRFRRLRVQAEFHIVACQNDATDKANLLDGLTRDKQAMVQRLKSSTMNKFKKREFYYDPDPDIQLVMSKGYVQVNMTGHVEDFNNVKFVQRGSVEKLNTKIKKLGKLKIDALSNLIALKKKMLPLKPKHGILKEHKVPLIKYRHHYISTMHMSKNIMLYLECTASGIDMVEQAKQQLDQELLNIKYIHNMKKARKTKTLDSQAEAIRKCERENIKIEVDIDRAIVGWSTLKIKISFDDLTGKLKSACDIRMKNIKKRTYLVSSVQKLQREVMILQTELDLMRLKRNPTL